MIKDKTFYKNLFLLAMPIILQNLVTYSVTLADNLMIGSLGDSAVSGVYMAGQVQTVLQVLSNGIDGTILLLAAQYWGKREPAQIRRIVKIGMTFSIAVGLIFTLTCALIPETVIGIFTNKQSVITSGCQYIQYVCWSYLFFCLTQSLISAMRSVEAARIGLIVSLISLGVDVVLNYALIFGKFGLPAMGVAGAGLATLIARIVETVTASVYVLFVDKKLRLIRRESLTLSAVLAYDRRLFGDFVRCGLPLMAGQLVWGLNLFSNSVILGRFSEGVMTAASLANTINSAVFVTINGLAAAVGITTGKKVGAGEVSDIKTYAHTVEILFLGIGLASGGLLFLLRDPFISLYSITPDAIAYSRQFIGVLCITVIGTCYQYPSLFGLVKSGGDVNFVARNDTMFVFLVVIPSAVVTALLGCPAWVVFFCLKIDQLLKCIPAFIKIRRFDWAKNLTH